MKKELKISNSMKGNGTNGKHGANGLKEVRFGNCITVSFCNDAGASEPADVMLYDDIGKDPWSGGGISAEDFANALKEIPRDREINLRINSRGGDVHTGMAMHNLLNAWPNKVHGIIDGVAASTASWVPMACDDLEMPETAQMFIHDAMCLTGGNADEMRRTADMLDKTSDQIAGMYAAKSGKSVDAMRDLMKAETLMTGKEAKKLGLVDKVTKTAAARNFTTEELSSMRNQLQTLKNSATPTGVAQPKTKTAEETLAIENVMTRAQIIALLNKLGIKFEDKATDAQLLELVNAIPAPVAEGDKLKLELQTRNAAAAKAVGDANVDLTALQTQINELKVSNTAARKLKIENSIQLAIDEDRIPAGQKNAWVNRAMLDETVLTDIAAMPARPPGAENLRAASVELTGEGFADVQKFILANGTDLTRKFVGGGAHNAMDKDTCRDIHNRGMKAALAMKKHHNMLVAMFNTNTIDANLQRQVILTDVIRAFAIRLLPLKAFCTTFANVPLEGTDTVVVPYFPLQTVASTAWVPATGYVAQNTASQAREVVVNKRSYQAMAFTSQELRRQPYQNWQELAAINAEKLGVDVNADVLSIVTAANYGASVMAIPAAAFDSTSVATLYGVATDLNWPDTGRSLVLTTGYKVALLQDPTFKQYLSAGTTDALRKAAIKDAYGFEDIYTVPTANLPSNGQNLTGFINHKSAALVATSPIMPAPAVRALMVQYDIVIDPDNGIALEYKLFGNAQLDNTIEVVECNYGYAAGVQTALARITSQ